MAQYHESGWLGAFGFVLTFTSIALMFALSYYEAFFAPVEAAIDPTFSEALFSRQLPDILMAVLYLSFIQTILGWMVMAIATTRARILPPTPRGWPSLVASCF